MDYTKIPIEMRAEVREWISNNDQRKLLELHDKYKLTEYKYGCCNMDGLMAFYLHGLQTQQI